MQQILKTGSARYQDITLCSFQGTIYAFARDTEILIANGNDNIVFNVLALEAGSQSDAVDWTGFQPVSFPTALRPAGMSLIQVDAAALSGSIAPAQTPFQVISDDTYLYIFRQSTAGTLLANRMVPTVDYDPQIGDMRYQVSPAWEVRFRDSGKVDVPANDKDIPSYLNANRDPFLDPTIELNFIQNVANGQFGVCLINGSTGQRWHVFSALLSTSQLWHYSLLKSDSEIIDLTDQTPDANGIVPPTNTFKLQIDNEGVPGDLPLLYAPTVALYTLRESLATSDGQSIAAQKSVRLALAQTVTNAGKSQVAFLDIGVLADGEINSFPEAFVLPSISPANYAFDFDLYAYVSLPNENGTLEIKGSFSFTVWVNPETMTMVEQQIIGDSSLDLKVRSAFLSIVDSGRVAIGFGASDEEIRVTSVDRVLDNNVWSLVEATFVAGSNGDDGTFSLKINGDTVVLDTATTAKLPVGTAVDRISEINRGCIGVVDSVIIINGAEKVADLPFNEIDFPANSQDPATTPDMSGKGNTGTVKGVRLIPSDVPVIANVQGNMYVDPVTGIRTYYGLLPFVETSASPDLLNGSNGLLHLYYKGMSDNPPEGLPNGFNVVQLDLNTMRAIFIAGWTAGSGSTEQTGSFQFLSQRAGMVMNSAEITVTPRAVLTAGLCDITFKVSGQFEENWKGVPSSLSDVSAILSGSFAFNPQDAGVLAGTRVFFDIHGAYTQARVPIDLEEKFAALNFVTRFTELLPLDHVTISETGENRSVVLTFTPTKTNWPASSPFIETWSNVPPDVRGFIDALNVIDPTGTSNSSATMNMDIVYLVSESQAIGNSVSFILHGTLTNVTMAITEGANSILCDVALTAEISGDAKSASLKDVDRNLIGFANILGGEDKDYKYSSLATGDYAAILNLWLPVAAGSQGSIQNRKASTALPVGDMQTAASFFAIFQSGKSALSALLPTAYDGAATKLQSGTDKAGPLLRGSQIFQGVAQSLPTNGAVAVLQGTADYTGGTANLSVQGADGGWINQPPQMGLNFVDTQYVNYSLAAPNIDSLSFAQDMCAETWVKPVSTTEASFNEKPQRVLTFNKTGRPGEPDALSQYAIGFEGTNCFQVSSRTYVTAASQMPGLNSSLELWVRPTQIATGGDVASIQSYGVAKPVLSLMMADKGAVKVSFGGTTLTSSSKLATNNWSHIVATMTDISTGTAGNVEVSLYLNGEFQTSQVIPYDIASKPVLGTLYVGIPDLGSVGVTGLQVNGASMWARALTASEIKRAVHWPLSDWSPSLHIRWKFVAGSGDTIKNYSIYGNQADGTVRGGGDVWIAGGIYTAFYFAYAGEAVKGIGTNLNNQWSHVAASYKRGTALGFSGAMHASTEPSDILNVDDGAAIELWLQAGSITDVQMAVDRDGSYEVQVLPGGYVSVIIQTSIGPIQLTSETALAIGDAAYIAVTFQSKIQSPPPSEVTTEPGKPPKYDVLAMLYQDGILQGTGYSNTFSDPVSITNAKTGLKLGQDAGGSSPFTGALAQLRLWKRALLPVEIELAYTSRTIPPNADGLIAAWNFSEMQGRIARDTGDTLKMVLSDDTMWQYLDQVSSILFMINGDGVTVLERVSAASIGGYGDSQFRVGMSANTPDIVGLKAAVDDVRLWGIARTVEQISDEQYRTLSGGETGLAGYWRFDTGSGTEVLDATGRGNDGSFGADAAAPLWIPSHAPISNETGAVYNSLGGIETNFNREIADSASVIEYADLQLDAYGQVFSVMKRCYAAPQSDGLLLITGYKVGDLDTVFVGQVQTEPKIIGFFEGAPPIPSENQTMPVWAGDITEYHTYSTATTVSVTVQQDITQSITGGLDNGSQQQFSSQIGLYGGTSAGTSAGLGWEADFGFFEANMKLGLALASESSWTSNKGVVQTFATTKTQVSTLTPGGVWEPEDQILNPTVGRRYVPDNLGTAVVKSRVADLYASRIKSTGQLVKLSIVPNPDIPEDVNLIDFPIDSTYIKNGTLDGQVGLVKDPDTGVSYFRPLEAYSLKRKVEQEQQQIDAYITQVNVDNIAMMGGYDTLVDSKLPANPSYNWSSNLSKRSIVNTYVWTAGGGTHADTVNFADSYSESWGSVRSSSIGIGFHFDFLVAAFVGVYAEMDFMSNTTLEMTGAKSKDRTAAVTMEATAAPDWFLSAPIVDGDNVSYSASPAPGKVEGYRYMSFYLSPSVENFEFFSKDLIDPLWLAQSQSPNAAALREAQMADNGSWRVLYRVTYVGRIPPAFQPSPDLVQAPALTPPANLDQNAIYTQLVSDQLNGAVDPSPMKVGAALLKVLGESPSDPGVLGTALSWWVEYLTLAEDYTNTQSVTLSELREDSLQYMLDGYESNAIEAISNVRLIGSR